MTNAEFIQALRSADSEKLVETAYHNVLRDGINAIGGHVEDLKTLHNTDGVLDGQIDFEGTARLFRIIIETKLEESFNLPIVRSRVLAQVVYYLKKFDELGEQLPNIVLVGDINECFVLHSNHLAKYLDRDYNWGIAPSSAGKRNIELLDELTKDAELQSECFVYEINDDFEFTDVMDKIESLAKGVKTQVRINEKSISKIFEYFSMRVLKRKATGESRYTAREQVEYFMQLVLNEEDCYAKPARKNAKKAPDTAIFKGVEVDVNRDTFESFTNHYKFDYNAIEKKNFTSIADRLIEDTDRRRKGDFYTPAIWVDEAHKMLAENLGPKWKEEYMVWDCAWGTGNLTRDYQFKELYASTLEEHDLKIGAKYNNTDGFEAFDGRKTTKFQYDFLNDDVEYLDELLPIVSQGYTLTEKDFYGTKLWEKAPGLVRGLLGGKKLLFFINPPYGTAGNMRKGTKGGLAKTNVNSIMNREKIGGCSQNLYAQFVYRILTLRQLFGSSISLSIFCKGSILTADSYKGLREGMLSSWSYNDGMVFQASNFADVSSAWGIYFTVWSDSLGDKSFKTTFPCKVKELDNSTVNNIETRLFYNLDLVTSCSAWVKSFYKATNNSNILTMSNAITLTGKLVNGDKGALCYALLDTNKVESNSRQVLLLPSKTKGHLSTTPIVDDNFYPILSYYTARRLVSGSYANWVNDKDEYMKPKVTHPLYKQWEYDSVVYSLFNTASNQSSLRNIEYNNKQWNILNHFFFMSKQDMQDLALGEHPNDDVYHDLQDHAEDERFVYNKLQEVTLSPDAQTVLDKARQLVKDSFQYREYFNQEHPEYHINTWDAGWYQIKGLLKEYMPEQLKEFNQLYKEFENRMRPLVVELGFLYDYPGYEEERKKYLGDVVYEVPEEEEISEPTKSEPIKSSTRQPENIKLSAFDNMMVNFNNEVGSTVEPEVSLEGEEYPLNTDVKGTKPLAIRIEGVEIQATSFRQVLTNTLKYLTSEHQEEFQKLIDNETYWTGKAGKIKSQDEGFTRSARLEAKDIYFETNFNSKSIMKFTQNILEGAGVDVDNCKLILK